uniref:Uncharacterized protein n=1 Tax=Rhizophagus irregularis (strain DAOM 181602 / DAOM 197198 / MUCL 43194) TaxID=747089 RepID=U9T9B2_RHIID
MTRISSNDGFRGRCVANSNTSCEGNIPKQWEISGQLTFLLFLLILLIPLELRPGPYYYLQKTFSISTDGNRLLHLKQKHPDSGFHSVY